MLSSSLRSAVLCCSSLLRACSSCWVRDWHLPSSSSARVCSSERPDRSFSNNSFSLDGETARWQCARAAGGCFFLFCFSLCMENGVDNHYQLRDNFDCPVFLFRQLKIWCETEKIGHHRKVKLLSQRRENGNILEIGKTSYKSAVWWKEKKKIREFGTHGTTTKLYDHLH